MAVDLNNTLAGDLLSEYATRMPAGSLLQIRTGAPPGAEEAAAGSLLAEITSPASPWAAPSGGSMAKSGVWSVAASGAGTAGHYRFKNAADTRREDGLVALGSGDMSLDNTSIAVGQGVTVNTFTKNL